MATGVDGTAKYMLSYSPRYSKLEAKRQSRYVLLITGWAITISLWDAAATVLIPLAIAALLLLGGLFTLAGLVELAYFLKALWAL